MLAAGRAAPHRRTGGIDGAQRVKARDVRHAERYVEADSELPRTAWPAARRAVSIRNGEQLT
jgi:hypothetical protein